MRPFLKWAGGKYRMIDRIRAKLPVGSRLLEPFVGSGAVFLNTDYPEYLLGDVNADLVNVYATLKEARRDFIEDCKALFSAQTNVPDVYYQFRSEFNSTPDPWRKAVLFVYLNRHGYNGLCRYNAAGGFNVPFGRYKHPYFPEAEMLYFAEKARRATFRHQPFCALMSEAVAGDVVYCDPPYVPLSATANFTSYTASAFGERQQQHLAEQARKLAGLGIPVLISNHATSWIERIYQGADMERFGVRRFISCQGRNRAVTDEILALFG